MIEKQKILEECILLINEKLNKLQNAIDGYKKDLLSESKSSAGDKHETGRAMLQLEMEKLGQQYQTVLVQKQALQKLDVSKKDRIQMGAVVFANGFYYFLATSIGQITIQEKNIMVVSANSPIGKIFIGKQKGDAVLFNGKQFRIEEVV